MQIELTNKEEISKVDINFLIDSLDKKLESGELNPLLLIEKFKAIEKIHEGIKSKLTKACVNEASKYPEKTFNLFGAEFKIQELGTKYDYSQCQDPIYQELKDQFDTIKEALEARQNFLKAIKNSETILDKNTGEIVTIYSPIKSSTTGIVCSIK